MLTAEQFLNRTSFVCADVNQKYLNYIITALQNTIESGLGTLFSLTTINEANADYPHIDIPGSNLDYIKIGAWQKTGLTVKIGYYGTASPTLTTLQETRDYRLVRYRDVVTSTQPNPVVALRLIGTQYTGLSPEYSENYSQKLNTEAFLRVTGTYGWSDGLPSDVEIYLMGILTQHIAQAGLTDSFAGKGQVTSEKDMTSSITIKTLDYDTLDKMLKNIMTDPAFQSLMNKYRQYTLKSRIS